MMQLLAPRPRPAPRSSAVLVTLALPLLAATVPAPAPARADERPTATGDSGKGPWEPVHDTDGVRVRRRTVAGTNLKEFQGRAVIEAPVGRVLAVLRDTARYCEWMPACAAAWAVESDEVARVHVSYNRIDAPWPVSDRDTVTRAQMRVEPAARRVYILFETITHPKVPPAGGVVRMPFVRGHWILIPRDKGQTTEVEYQVHANPGGRLPDWLANLTSKKLPDETIRGLRLQVRRRQYPEFEDRIARSDELRLMVAATESAPAP